MTEYDAFGNPIAPTGSTGPTPLPQTRPEAPGGGVGRGRRRGFRAVLIGMSVPVVAVIAVAVVGVVASNPGPSSSSYSYSYSDSYSSSFTTTSSTTARTTRTTPAKQPAKAKRPPKPQGPPTGLGRGSLLLPRTFAAAMSEIRRRAGGGKLVYVRVEPTRVDVQVKLPKRGLRMIQRPWNHRATVIADAPSGSAPATMPWSAVDPAAPSRLATTVRNGSRRPSKQLSYAVLLAGLHQWSAFRPDGTFYTSGLSGRDAQRRSS